MFSKLAPILAALATTTIAGSDGRTFAVLHFYGDGPLTTGRMDPIVSPGKPSSHEHVIMGGSNFALSMSDDTLQKSSCTNAKIVNDKSNYWTPSVYFQDPTTKAYTPVPFYYQNVYYFFEKTNDKIVAFPPGLRILVGDPDLRTPPSTGEGINVLSKGNPVAQPVQFTCPRGNYAVPSYPPDSDGLHGFGLQDPNNKGAGAGFPNAQCDGKYSPLRADIHFPSCYNPAAGLDDYKNNMVYPTDTGNGNQDCPNGFLHVPHMFYEVYWDTQKFSDKWTPGKDAQPFVLANGDSTGYSLHADFISGWDTATLQHIIDTCNTGDSGMENCLNVPGGINDSKGTCNIPNLVAEAASTAGMSLLPGGLSTTGFGAKVGGGGTPPASSIAPSPIPSSTAVAAASTVVAAASTVVQSQSPQETAPAPTHAAASSLSHTASTPGWGALGCYKDDVNDRVLSGKTFVAIGNHQVTSWACSLKCDAMGFTMAGTEYGGQCFCGNSLDSAEKLDDSACDMACEGDSKQTCGGKAALSVFQKAGSASKARRDIEPAGRLHRHLARHVHKAF